MRLLRALLLVKLGAWVGIAVAAAIAKRAMPSRGDEESDELALVAIFDGIDLKSRAAAFRGGSMFSWFGGIAVDLREATLAPPAKLAVTTLCGGIAIRVPPGWRIESTARAVWGGVSDEVPEPDDPNAPTLVVNGLALFGGIAIGAKAGDESAES